MTLADWFAAAAATFSLVVWLKVWQKGAMAGYARLWRLWAVIAWLSGLLAVVELLIGAPPWASLYAAAVYTLIGLHSREAARGENATS